jgi:hypothetical protein
MQGLQFEPIEPEHLVEGNRYRILPRDQNPNNAAFVVNQTIGIFVRRHGNMITFTVNNQEQAVDATTVDVYPFIAPLNMNAVRMELPFNDPGTPRRGQGGPPGGSPGQGAGVGGRRNKNKSRKQQQKRKDRKTRQRRQRNNRTRRLH